MTIIIHKKKLHSTPQTFNELNSSIEAAQIYDQCGYSPVPVKPQSKIPALPWKTYSFDPKSSCEDFSSGCGVALHLGNSHGGVVDIDLDCPEARELAPHFLPPTDCIFGHQSSPASHHIYTTTDQVQTRKYQCSFADDPEILLEIRGENHLTVFPPSIHESGEKIRFEQEKAGLPSQVSASDLIRASERLAATSMLSKVWPKTPGCRQDLALSLCGGMLKGGLDQEEAEKIIELAAANAGDEEAKERGHTVISTGKKIESGHPVTGWPTATELLGDEGSYVVNDLITWLGLQAMGNLMTHWLNLTNRYRFNPSYANRMETKQQS